MSSASALLEKLLVDCDAAGGPDRGEGRLETSIVMFESLCDESPDQLAARERPRLSQPIHACLVLVEAASFDLPAHSSAS